MKKPKTYKPPSMTIKSGRSFKKKQESARKKGYDRDWDRYRFRFLHHNPYCYICGKESKVVDHIKAHKGNTELFEATNNHMPLCTICHNTITGRFDRMSEQDIEGKINYINKMREYNGVTIKIKVVHNYRK